ncbi:MAG: hypothetical protein H0X03_05130 [Nitrosopumilus sp.]|nr:hypothetical protein [Nitrosopumilus sp.]
MNEDKEKSLEQYMDFSNKNLQNIMEFTKSLGNNVIEEKRQHRLSYAKSLTFRVFADIKTNNQKILITLKKNRKENPITYTISGGEDIGEIKNLIKEAYEKIS